MLSTGVGIWTQPIRTQSGADDQVLVRGTPSRVPARRGKILFLLEWQKSPIPALVRGQSESGGVSRQIENVADLGPGLRL